MLYFKRERVCTVFAEVLCPQIANLQRATFVEGPQIYQIIQVPKFAYLRFVEPIFANLLNIIK
jgi:hypothetical protein